MLPSALIPFETALNPGLQRLDGSLPAVPTSAAMTSPGRITLNTGLRQVFVNGTHRNDNIFVSKTNSQTVRINFAGVETKDFNIADFDSILFKGRNGNDLFNNTTAIASFVFGDNDDDRIYGGNGIDDLNGGAGNDRIYGRDGNDTLSGVHGDDYLSGGNGDDWLRGGLGDDEIRGDNGNDVLIGDAGNDRIFGGAGNDTLQGWIGNDYLDGQGGDDRLFAHAGNDTLLGGADSDYLNGGDDDDILSGNAGNDQLYGVAGNDHLSGGAGDDLLFGGTGADVLLGESGVDILRGGNGNDVLLGGTNSYETDVLRGESGQDHLLYFTGHALPDSSIYDLRLKFTNATSAWTAAEILVINRGLQKVHDATGNWHLATDYLTGEDLNLVKYQSLQIGATAVNDLSISTRNTVTTYTREIRFSEWDENSEPLNGARVLAFVHEIAHNFDDDFELQANPRVAVVDFTNFKALSGWRSTNPHNSNYAPSQDGEWWYRRSSQFYRSYSTINPFEDWATVWELYFDDSATIPPPSSNLGKKLAAVDRFIGKLS